LGDLNFLYCKAVTFFFNFKI